MRSTPVDARRGPVATAVVTAVAMESAMWRNLFRWVFRRPEPLPAGTSTFGYTREAVPPFWVFIGVSAVEIPLLDLLLPTLTWRLVGLALGLWGLLWMLGLVGSIYVRPHLVGPDGIRVRFGMLVDHHLPADAIAEVGLRTATVNGTRTAQVEESADGVILSVAASSRTTVEILLSRPLILRAPKVGLVGVTVVRCFAEDAAGFIAAARANADTWAAA